MHVIDNNYPCWSDAFGCVIRNRQHRAQLEKRYGMRRVTKNDLERAVDKQVDRDKEAEDNERQVDEEYRNSPHFKDFRRAIDRGALTKDMPPGKREYTQKQLYQKYCK